MESATIAIDQPWWQLPCPFPPLSLVEIASGASVSRSDASWLRRVASAVYDEACNAAYSRFEQNSFESSVLQSGSVRDRVAVHVSRLSKAESAPFALDESFSYLLSLYSKTGSADQKIMVLEAIRDLIVRYNLIPKHRTLSRFEEEPLVRVVNAHPPIVADAARPPPNPSDDQNDRWRRERSYNDRNSGHSRDTAALRVAEAAPADVQRALLLWTIEDKVKAHVADFCAVVCEAAAPSRVVTGTADAGRGEEGRGLAAAAAVRAIAIRVAAALLRGCVECEGRAVTAVTNTLVDFDDKLRGLAGHCLVQTVRVVPSLQRAVLADLQRLLLRPNAPHRGVLAAIHVINQFVYTREQGGSSTSTGLTKVKRKKHSVSDEAAAHGIKGNGSLAAAAVETYLAVFRAHASGAASDPAVVGAMLVGLRRALPFCTHEAATKEAIAAHSDTLFALASPAAPSFDTRISALSILLPFAARADADSLSSMEWKGRLTGQKQPSKGAKEEDTKRSKGGVKAEDAKDSQGPKEGKGAKEEVKEKGRAGKSKEGKEGKGGKGLEKSKDKKGMGKKGEESDDKEAKKGNKKEADGKSASDAAAAGDSDATTSDEEAVERLAPAARRAARRAEQAAAAKELRREARAARFGDDDRVTTAATIRDDLFKFLQEKEEKAKEEGGKGGKGSSERDVKGRKKGAVVGEDGRPVDDGERQSLTLRGRFLSSLYTLIHLAGVQATVGLCPGGASGGLRANEKLAPLFSLIAKTLAFADDASAAAISKRLVSVAVTASASPTPFLGASLRLVGRFLRSRPSLRKSMLDKPDGAVFDAGVDASKKDSSHKKGKQSETAADSASLSVPLWSTQRVRNPAYVGAEDGPLWALTRMSHTPHQGLKKIVADITGAASFEGDPLSVLTATYFLDRFAYKQIKNAHLTVVSNAMASHRSRARAAAAPIPFNDLTSAGGAMLEGADVADAAFAQRFHLLRQATAIDRAAARKERLQLAKVAAAAFASAKKAAVEAAAATGQGGDAKSRKKSFAARMREMDDDAETDSGSDGLLDEEDMDDEEDESVISAIDGDAEGGGEGDSDATLSGSGGSEDDEEDFDGEFDYEGAVAALKAQGINVDALEGSDEEEAVVAPTAKEKGKGKKEKETSLSRERERTPSKKDKKASASTSTNPDMARALAALAAVPPKKTKKGNTRAGADTASVGSDFSYSGMLKDPNVVATWGGASDADSYSDIDSDDVSSDGEVAKMDASVDAKAAKRGRKEKDGAAKEAAAAVAPPAKKVAKATKGKAAPATFVDDARGMSDVTDAMLLGKRGGGDSDSEASGDSDVGGRSSESDDSDDDRTKQTSRKTRRAAQRDALERRKKHEVERISADVRAISVGTKQTDGDADREWEVDSELFSSDDDSSDDGKGKEKEKKKSPWMMEEGPGDKARGGGRNKRGGGRGSAPAAHVSKRSTVGVKPRHLMPAGPMGGCGGVTVTQCASDCGGVLACASGGVVGRSI